MPIRPLSRRPLCLGGPKPKFIGVCGEHRPSESRPLCRTGTFRGDLGSPGDPSFGSFGPVGNIGQAEPVFTETRHIKEQHNRPARGFVG